MCTRFSAETHRLLLIIGPALLKLQRQANEVSLSYRPKIEKPNEKKRYRHTDEIDIKRNRPTELVDFMRFLANGILAHYLM